jgi:hypothetical protein
MGFGLSLTTGPTWQAVNADTLKWLVEARVETELSKPYRFALRFEDDICEGKREIAGSDQFKKDVLVGLFVEAAGKLECLVYGPITKVKSSSALGGPGSWVEFHGEDRRHAMGRMAVSGTHVGKASQAAAKILKAYNFKADTQDTRIEHDTKDKQLTQNGTDLAFLEDVARRNNMELWIDYAAEKSGDKITLTETAKLRTSPPRSQSGDKPQLPTLIPGEPKLVLRVSPPPGEKCANINKFETRIDFEKPASAKGFAMTDDEDKKLVADSVAKVEPVDPTKKPLQIEGMVRDLPKPEPLTEERRLAMEGLVLESSWFVEVDCSATLEQLGFLVRPHQIVQVANAGDELSGGYQVMKAVHVVTAADHYIDFTMRANGLGAKK